jgi:chemotaxis signal transduction protein
MDSSLINNSSSLTNRVIITLVSDITLAIPAIWVGEILRFDRTQVLNLPFYNPLLLGIVHYQGTVLPLISSHGLLKTNSTDHWEKLMVIKLNRSFGLEQEIGLVVDKVLNAEPTNHKLVKLSPKLIPETIWQPQRWLKNN